MIFSKILATGSYLPETVLPNAAFETRLETTDAWIVERTGIRERHIVNESETTVSMGVIAAQRALESAGIEAKDIDMIVVATCTPDKIFPSTACLIQNAMGIPPCPAFDVQAACSGFIYALSVVDQFVRSGMVKRPLIIGSETMSRTLDWQDRRTCILFGDGAGAVILEASKEPGIISTFLSADGGHKEALFLDNLPGSFLQMQGNTVFKLAVKLLDQVASDTLAKANLDISDIHWLVPHQANIRIIAATAEKLGLPMERVIVTVGEHGNTAAASIPLALDIAIREGRIQRGQNILLESIGGGLAWGTALVKY